ncbi:hypothetical protein AB0L67_41280 [Streptomyces flaveolus]|uniref:hypothetical protein n=1 Tax=Streptomyces flaveolus TaxID=67297 RepID=UPI0034372831
MPCPAARTRDNFWLPGALRKAAVSAARTDTVLGARYHRSIKRRNHLKALVAVARSILLTVWHLMNDPTARYRALGPDCTPKTSTLPARPATSSASSPPSTTMSPPADT